MKDTNSYENILVNADVDEIFSINNKDISAPEVYKDVVVRGDNKSNSLIFKMNKIIDGVDISDKTIKIFYINAEGYTDIVTSENIYVTEEHILFTWLIDSNVTAVSGTVNFIVQVQGSDYLWKSKPSTIEVVDTLDGALSESNPYVSEWSVRMEENIKALNEGKLSVEEAEAAKAEIEEALTKVDAITLNGVPIENLVPIKTGNTTTTYVDEDFIGFMTSLGTVYTGYTPKSEVVKGNDLYLYGGNAKENIYDINDDIISADFQYKYKFEFKEGKPQLLRYKKRLRNSEGIVYFRVDVSSYIRSIRVKTVLGNSKIDKTWTFDADEEFGYANSGNGISLESSAAKTYSDGLIIDTTNGKFSNVGRKGNFAQVNSGTLIKFPLPSLGKYEINVVGYSGLSMYLCDDFCDIGEISLEGTSTNNTVSQTITFNDRYEKDRTINLLGLTDGFTIKEPYDENTGYSDYINKLSVGYSGINFSNEGAGYEYVLNKDGIKLSKNESDSHLYALGLEFGGSSSYASRLDNTGITFSSEGGSKLAINHKGNDKSIKFYDGTRVLSAITDTYIDAPTLKQGGTPISSLYAPFSSPTFRSGLSVKGSNSSEGNTRNILKVRDKRIDLLKTDKGDSALIAEEITDSEGNTVYKTRVHDLLDVVPTVSGKPSEVHASSGNFSYVNTGNIQRYGKEFIRLTNSDDCSGLKLFTEGSIGTFIKLHSYKNLSDANNGLFLGARTNFDLKIFNGDNDMPFHLESNITKVGQYNTGYFQLQRPYIRSSNVDDDVTSRLKFEFSEGANGQLSESIRLGIGNRSNIKFSSYDNPSTSESWQTVEVNGDFRLTCMSNNKSCPDSVKSGFEEGLFNMNDLGVIIIDLLRRVESLEEKMEVLKYAEITQEICDAYNAANGVKLSDWEYDTSTGTITNYKGTATSVVTPLIPNVTKLSDCFNNNSTIEHIKVSYGINSIQSYEKLSSNIITPSTFYNCSKLKSIELPSTLAFKVGSNGTPIGGSDLENKIQGCNNLTDLILHFPQYYFYNGEKYSYYVKNIGQPSTCNVKFVQPDVCELRRYRDYAK